MKHNKLHDFLLVFPGYLIYTVFMIVPLGMTMFYSFTNWDGISKKFKMIGFKNFVRLFSDAQFYNALKVTLIITVITVLIYNVLGVFLAVALNRKNRVCAFTKSAVFVPTVLSSVVVAFIWSYIMQTDGGVINTLLALVGIAPVNFYKTPLDTIVMISVIISWNGLGLFLETASVDEITAALERIIREAPSFRARVEERRNKYTYAGLVDRLETDYQELA